MNEDQIILLIITAILNGAMLALGMWIGTRQSAKSIIKEFDVYLKKSELFKLLTKTLTDQTLLDKATKFFDEATTLVSSEEAKNFFKNVTELMKELSGETPAKLELPKKPDGGG